MIATNPLKKFLNLFPKQKRYYGRIISKTGNTIAVELLQGGMMKIVSSSTIDINNYVWLENRNDTWEIIAAPQFLNFYIVEV